MPTGTASSIPARVRPWLATVLVIALHACLSGLFLLHHGAVPWSDEAQYVAKTRHIARAAGGSIRSWLRPATYLAAPPLDRGPLGPGLAAALLGRDPRPHGIALVWLALREGLLLLGLLVVAGEVGHSGFAPAAALAILGGPSQFNLLANQYTADTTFECLALLAFALHVRDLRRRDLGSASAAAAADLALCLVKPAAPVLLAPLFAVLGVHLLRVPPPSGLPGARGRAVHLAPYAVLGLGGAWLAASPYGQGVRDLYALGSQGYWADPVTRFELAMWAGLLVPPWLLAMTLASLARHRLRGANLSLTLTAGVTAAWWYAFNTCLAYATQARLIAAAGPLAVTAALALACRTARARAACTLLAAATFALGAARVCGWTGPRWVQAATPYTALIPPAQRPVAEVGLLPLAADLGAATAVIEPGTSPVHVQVTFNDTYVDPESLALAADLVGARRLAIEAPPLGSTLLPLADLLQQRWWLTKERRQAIPLRGDANVGLAALARMVGNPASPLRGIFQARGSWPVRQPGLDDRVTLWTLERPPSPEQALAALRWVEPLFEGTPGAAPLAEEVSGLERRVRTGTGLLVLDPAEADRLAGASLPGVRGVAFAGRLRLRAAVPRPAGAGGEDGLDLVWEALGDQGTDTRVAVHILDSAGHISRQADHPLELFPGRVRAGTLWLDRVRLGRDVLARADAIGLGVYAGSGPLWLADRGPRDWEEHRLVLRWR